MNLLVTGGAGYIGSHFCKAAHRAGHRVVVLDDLSQGHREFVKWGPLVEASILDQDQVLQTLKAEKIEGVVHFAAKSQVGESVKKPDLYRRVNVEGTKALLNAMAQSKVKYFIFSSSAATYGQPEVELITETTPQYPINPYGQTKLEAERILLEGCSKLHIQLAVLRYFNVIGQDTEGELKEKHEPETHLVPNLLKAYEAHRPFSLFGTDYPTPDGTCIRDYVDVVDLAEVHLRALAYLKLHPGALISNVGHGRGYSVAEVLNAFKETFGGLPKVIHKNRRPGDPPKLVASAKFFKTWCDIPLKSLSESLQSLKS